MVNKYEPTSKMSVVGKLAAILRTPFNLDFHDILTVFERKIMIYETRSRDDQCFPENWLSHRRYGPEEHERTHYECHELQQLDEIYARDWVDRARKKAIITPTPMDVDAFQKQEKTLWTTLSKNNLCDDDRNIADSNHRASVGVLRLSILGLVKHIEFST